jgi:hypothetical protein
MESSPAGLSQPGVIRPVLYGPASKWIVPVAFLLIVSSCCGQNSATDADKAIQDKLAAPPVFLDAQHEGPNLVPKDLPEQIVPFDCRATEVYLHQVHPGQYHFERAQRLLGQGLD